MKVEMWDVVDKGIRPDVEWAGVTGAGGKEQEGTDGANVVLLDASAINVYQVRMSSTFDSFCWYDRSGTFDSSWIEVHF